MIRGIAGICVLGSAMAIAVGATVPAWAHGITERVSLGRGGVQSDYHSRGAAISANGRFVAFTSGAENLVPGDTNGFDDVFVRDRQTGTTRRVSLGPGGAQADADSFGRTALSADGRFIAFNSFASNLVPGDTNGDFDVFVRDRQTGTTERVSLGLGGAQGNDGSYGPALSADGRFVAFTSGASNLVPGDTNGFDDVFVRDRRTGTTQRVNLGLGGAQGNDGSGEAALSADGRFVAFDSGASNLVPGDTNGDVDVFVRDRQTGTTQRVSLGPGGIQGHGDTGTSRYSVSISANGRFVAFNSLANNLVPGDTNVVWDVFVRDRQTGTTRRVSLGRGGAQGNDDSVYPAISADGRFVAFTSAASNLVPGDTNDDADVFVRDCKTGTTRRASLGPDGVQGNRNSGIYSVSISADGRFVAFDSDANNLVPGDTNVSGDVFVRHLVP